MKEAEVFFMNGIVPIIILLIALVLGILYCFWGYKYLKVIIFLYAFFMGAYYSYTLVGTYLPDATNWLWLISLIIGLVFALLSFFFIKFAIFVVGGIVGLLVYGLLRSGFAETFSSMDPMTLFIIGLGLFVVFGAITLASQRHFVIIFSAIFGGYTIIHTVGIIIGLFFNSGLLSTITWDNYQQVFESISIFPAGATWALVIPTAVFAIAGMVAQYRFTAPSRRK